MLGCVLSASPHVEAEIAGAARTMRPPSFAHIPAFHIHFAAVCEKVAGTTSLVTKYWWVRGVLYIGMAAGGYALTATTQSSCPVNGGSNCWYILIPMTGLAVAGILFIVATLRREPSKGDEAAAAAGKPAPPAVPPPGVFGNFFQRKTDDTVNKAATAAGAAAGKSVAQSMFGTKSEDPEVPPAPAPAPAGPTASMFTGGGLFGGSSSSSGAGASAPAAVAAAKSSKYGYDATSPEANPFVT